MLNPFFLQGSQGEQGLVQDLINEHLKIFGIDVFYLPRQYVNEKTIIKEVLNSEFNFAYPIEAYVDSYEGYGGQGTILSKFGIQELDDVNLIISKERWENYIQPLIKNLPDVKLSTRPKEGDLIYFPLGDRLFEIKYVEHEKPFYQLQKNYVYELRCELFRYEDEVIDTGIVDIDDNIEKEGPIQLLQMVGVGRTATAITSIVNGAIRFVTITNRGSGYQQTPTVAFSSAPFNGVTATGIATMISGIVDICEPDESLLRVQGVQLTNPGAGYTVAPKISFLGGEGKSTAVGFTTIGNGVVGIITVTNGGSGYISPPQISFIGISSEPAQAFSKINSSGSVTEIRLVNSGLGYSTTPTIQIQSPQIIVGSGSYEFNEIVVGSSSSTRARVKNWNSTNNILQVSNTDGNFIPGERLIGQKSNASYLFKINMDDVANQNVSTPTNPNISPNTPRPDKFGQNVQIEFEADQIVDFSEVNPFGTP